MCLFKKEDYKKYDHDEKIFNWILVNGHKLDSLITDYRIEPKHCDRCEVIPTEDDNTYYLLDEEGNVTNQEYEVEVYGIDCEKLIEDEEIPILTEKEKEELLRFDSVLVIECSSCGQWCIDLV